MQISRNFIWKTSKVYITKIVPHEKLVEGEEVVQSPEMTFNAGKWLLKAGREISLYSKLQRLVGTAKPAPIAL